MDSIANLIVKLKNAGLSRKKTVVLTHSKIRASILDCLLEKGFIHSVIKKGKKVVKFLEITLSYHDDGTPKIREVKRISKPSKRVYIKYKDIKPVRSGYGIIVLSTPNGIMSGEDAKKQKIGGEALFKVW